ncbi:Fatty acid 2-hydroxylase [Trichinella sp. T8]|nr:Fatty acid 2-hydroxylase [Trichinella sp. T8]
MDCDSIVVDYAGERFDLANFACKHPGGSSLIKACNGRQIDSFMNGTEALFGKKHRHSIHAYRLLKHYCLETQKRNFGVDVTKPLIGQVGLLREKYWNWAHQPICENLRIFHSEMAEMITKTKWYTVPAVWMPLVIYLAFKGCQQFLLSGISSLSTTVLFLIMFFAGFTLWTFMEYIIHRFGFHWKPSANSERMITLHFLMHGLHHKTPMDKNRLVFPPLIALPVVGFVFLMYKSLLPWPICLTVSSGNLFGYICYDLIHYYLHHGEPSANSYLHQLKVYHYNHHFSNTDKAFGISSAVWDVIFQTVGSFQ